ncbi:hypothetical protein DID88_008584 [Monilinia fructigena]|uniref:Septum formation protein Maf n=1 Tax=Monilinia fructigena TaxID=38457 RepID=A0A395J6T4_9HELO|nr:hypothetical protein DID88_008584 [Monilinia fructigena]
MPDEKYTPVATSPSSPPPTYETSSAQQSKLPSRPASKSISSIKGPLPRGPFPLDIPLLQHLKGKRIILASASPRRKQILASIGLTNLEIIPSPLPKTSPKNTSAPSTMSPNRHPKMPLSLHPLPRQQPRQHSGPLPRHRSRHGHRNQLGRHPREAPLATRPHPHAAAAARRKIPQSLHGDRGAGPARRRPLPGLQLRE